MKNENGKQLIYFAFAKLKKSMLFKKQTVAANSGTTGVGFELVLRRKSVANAK